MKQAIGKTALLVALFALLGSSKVHAAPTGNIAPAIPPACNSGDTTKFPYGFICPSDNTNFDAITTYTSTDRNILENSTSYIDFRVGFVASRDAVQSRGGSPTGILLWTTVDTNNSVYRGITATDNSNISTTGGDASYACPHSGAYPAYGSTQTIPSVFNFQDDAGAASGRPNASPAAWDGVYPNGYGSETCLTEGRMVYWTSGGNFNYRDNFEKSFRLHIDTNANAGKQICIRTNVSVSYNGNRWPTNPAVDAGSATISANDGNTASRVAKQSRKYCFTIYNKPPHGVLSFTCSNAPGYQKGYRISGMYDEDHGDTSSRQGFIQYRILRKNSNGSYTEVQNNTVNPTPYVETGLYDFSQSTRYKLQVYDVDNGVAYDQNEIMYDIGCDPPATYCNTLTVGDQGTAQGFRTNTYVDVYDSAGNHLVDSTKQTALPDSGHLGQGEIETWPASVMTPKGKSIRITIKRVQLRPIGPVSEWVYSQPSSDPLNDTNYGSYGSFNNDTPGFPRAVANLQSQLTIDCFAATCKVNSVVDAATGGFVRAGQPYRVNYEIKNTGKLSLPGKLGAPALGVTEGTDWHDFNGGVNIGATEADSYTSTGNAPVGNFNVTIQPSYFNLFNLGPSCTIPVSAYRSFTLSPTLSAAFDDNESPTSLAYSVKVNNSLAQTIDVGTTSCLYAGILRTNCNLATIASNNVSSFPPGDTNTLGPANMAVTGPINAGLQYCVYIVLPAASGWINAAGTIEDPVAWAGNPVCDQVHNKPFFKAYGNGVSAGGILGGSCTGTGILASWNGNPGTNPNYGSGSVLEALASGQITGFASAQRSITPIRSPIELTFANTTAAATGSPSPDLGGNFGSTSCLPAIEPPDDNRVPESGSTADLGTGNFGALPGKYAHIYPATTDVTINGGTISAGANVSIFVDGDAYISSNISYAGSLDANHIPSLVLKATGNIYIDPSVTDLSGLYVAVKNSSNKKGKIFTCGTAYTPVSQSSMYDTCKQQLVVHGSFVADQVNLMRTYGSLRNEQPSGGGAAQIGVIWSCGGGVCPAPANMSTMTCAQITNASEPASSTWYDNYLCLPSGKGYKIGWVEEDPSKNFSAAAAIAKLNTNPSTAGMSPSDCQRWEVSEAEAPYSGEGSSWENAWLCNTAGLTFSYTGQIPGKYCTPIIENDDPHANGIWNADKAQTFICEPLAGPPTPPTPPLNCSSAVGGASHFVRLGTRYTCAAEVFDFSPDLYLSNPAIMLPSYGADVFDSVTSLPPVL